MKSDKLEKWYAGQCSPSCIVYGANEVDAAIAELKVRNVMFHDEAKYYKAEIESLKAKLESVQASAYADSVDAGMRERRLRRALYKACANWADVEVFERTVGIVDPNVEANRWALMRNKCLKKVEEYQ